LLISDPPHENLNPLPFSFFQPIAIKKKKTKTIFGISPNKPAMCGNSPEFAFWPPTIFGFDKKKTFELFHY
jgi:hypothetical protein